MAVTRVQSASIATVYTANTAQYTSLAVTLPTAPAAGNLLLAAWSVDKSSGVITPPAGWTTVLNRPGASVSLLVAYKVAAGTEGAVTASWATIVEGASAVIVEYAGVAAADPFGPQDLSTYSDTARTSAAFSAGPAEAAGLAVSFLTIDSTGSGSGDNTGFVPAATGYTLIQNAFAANRGNPALALLESPVASGATTAPTFAWTWSDQAQGVVLLLNEAVVVVPTLVHRAVGIPSGTAVPVAARLTGTASARLKLGTDAAVTTGVVYGPAATPNAQGDVQLTATGLTPGTQYYHQVAMTSTTGGAEVLSAASAKPFRTAPTGQASFSFSFGSCDNAVDSPAFAAIASWNDDLFFHLGDAVSDTATSAYADGGGTGIEVFRARMAEKFAAPNHALVYSTTPSGMLPSDHDGHNNGSTAASDPTAWTNWNTAYREFWPTLTLPGATGVYRTFTWGRVRFIQLDTRSFKTAASATDNASKTALGATQKQWLKDTILASTEALIVILQDGPWNAAPIAGDDNWAGYTTERNELAAFFTASGKRIGMLGGDMHALAADDGTNAPGLSFLLHGAPLSNAASQKGGPYTTGPYPASGTATVQQYGRCVVTDSGNQISIAFTGYSDPTTARLALTETFSLDLTAGRADTLGLADSVTATVGKVMAATPADTLTAADGTAVTAAGSGGALAIGTPKVGAIANYPASGTTSTVAYPTGVAVGDFLLIALPARPAAATDAAYTAPGWTGIQAQAGTNTRITALWRIATAADVGASPVTVTGGAVLRSLKMIAVPGVDPTTPIDKQSTYTGTDADTTAPNMPTLTPSVAGCMPLWLGTGFLGAGVTWSPTQAGAANATGVTEWLDTWQESTGSDGRAGFAYWQTPLASTAATGTRGATPTTLATSAGLFLLLRPKAAAATAGSIGDSARATDSVTAVTAPTIFDYTQSPVDALGGTDAATDAVTAARTATDTAGLTDAATASLGRNAVAADALGATDLAGAGALFDNQAADTATGTDTVGDTVTAARTVADPGPLTDAATTARTVPRPAADALAATDAATVGRGAQATDAAALGDDVALAQGPGRDVADPVVLTDATVLARVRPITETAALTDAVGWTKGVRAADTLGATDAAADALAARRDPADAVEGTDTAWTGGSAGRPVQTTANVVAEAAVGVRHVHRLRASALLTVTATGTVVAGPDRAVVSVSVTGTLSAVRTMRAPALPVEIAIPDPRVRIVRAMTDVIRTFDELPMGLASDMPRPDPTTADAADAAPAPPAPRRIARAFLGLRP